MVSAARLVLAVALVVGCTSEDGGDGGPDPVDAGNNLEQTLSGPELELFTAINAERTAQGLTELALKETILCAARAHAADVGPQGLCSHTGTDGSDPTARVERCGGTSSGWSGQIIACGASAGDVAVAGWAVDPQNGPHLLSATNITVGVGMDSNYWVAVFDN